MDLTRLKFCKKSLPRPKLTWNLKGALYIQLLSFKGGAIWDSMSVWGKVRNLLVLEGQPVKNTSA